MSIKSELFDEYAVFKKSPERGSKEAKKIWGRKGIYIFLFVNEIKLTEEQIRKYNTLKGARIKKEYIKLYNGDYSSDMCLYVGSCIHNSLYVRLRQHFRDNNSTKIGALHLGAKERAFLEDKVIAYAFPIKKQFEDDLRIIVPGLEYEMHNQFYPMVGSPRV